MAVLVGILATLVVLVAAWLYLKPKKQPPGPRGLPWIGSPPPNYHEEVVSLVKKYGDVVMIKFGFLNFLYIADFNLVRSAFNKMEFSDRPQIKAFRGIRDGKATEERLGVVTSSGDRWKHNRRFLLKSLRDLGMGKTQQETSIHEEVEALMACLTKLAGQPTDIPYEINLAFMNITKLLTSGERFDYENAEMERLLRDVNELEKLVRVSTLDKAFPVFHRLFNWFLPDFIDVTQAAIDFSRHFYDSHQKVISDHMATLEVNSPRDFIDHYLIEMEKDSAQSSSMFDMDDLHKLVLDLFVAGNDTSANLFKNILLYLASFTEHQESLRKKIDEVLGTKELPRLHHRERLPAVDAFVNEVARLAAPGLFGVFHATSSDVELAGYQIPKGTIVFPTTSLIHRDPRYWKNPNQFDPDRFLSDDGKLLLREAFLPFGVGKRVCAGESMARMWMFIMTCAVLQRFRVGPPSGSYIDLTPERTPHKWNAKEQKIVFTPRTLSH